jgi:hypothetical protein
MGDEAIDAIVPENLKKPTKFMYDWFSWTFFGPARAMAQAGKFVVGGVSHAFGAKTDQEKQDEFNRIAHKSVVAVGNSNMNWKQYESAETAIRSSLTPQEFDWMTNNYGRGFFNKLEKSHHDIWFQTSRIMVNRQRAMTQIKDHVFIDDDLMNRIKDSADKKFYGTLQDYTSSHIDLKEKTQLKGQRYVDFVNSKQNLGTFINEQAKASNYTSADDFYYDVTHKTTVRKMAERRQKEQNRPLPANQTPIKEQQKQLGRPLPANETVQSTNQSSPPPSRTH